jgi:nucleoside-diphosphate-sugar epimerase
VPTTFHVVTGASGLLGSHIVEQLRQRGDRVRALVRASSDPSFLKEVGADVVVADLANAAALRPLVEGATAVYHCAAKVGEWGPWRLFQEGTIDATRNLLEACRDAGVGRVLHVSSITVYGHPPPRADLYTEDEPLGQNLWWVGDNYRRAKIAAEALCRTYPGPLTIVRPSWMYGPRDRTSVPRVLRAFERGRVRIVGRGDNLLNIIYAGDVARAAILAAETPVAVGRAYNLASAGEITQCDFLDVVTDLLGQPPIRKRVPYGLMFGIGFALELAYKALRRPRPPVFTRYVVSLIGRSTRFSTARAATELGWRPEIDIRAGLRRTLPWYYRSSGRQLPPKVAAMIE